MSKSFAMAAAIAIVSTAGAQAACKTATLAGDWDVGSTIGACTVKIDGVGKVTGSCSGLPVSGKLALSSACKITGKINGDTTVGRTEAIATSSSLKPNLILGSTNGNLGPFAAYRR